MLESRWGRRLGPGIAALAGVLVIATTSVGAAPTEGRPPPACAAQAGRGPGRRRAAARGSGSSRRSRADVVIGQRLAVGQGRGRAWSMTLDAGVVRDRPDGRAGRGRHGRRAPLDGLGHRHDPWLSLARGHGRRRRPQRGPGSGWPDGHGASRRAVRPARPRDLAAASRARRRVRVLPGPDPDPAFGRTWLTELHWSGRRLVVVSLRRGRLPLPRARSVESGGPVRWPTRRSAPSSASPMTPSWSVAPVAACPVRCSAPTWRVGAVTTLVDDAGPAVLADDAAGTPVVVTASPDGHDLRAVAPRRRGRRDRPVAARRRPWPARRPSSASSCHPAGSPSSDRATRSPAASMPPRPAASTRCDRDPSTSPARARAQRRWCSCAAPGRAGARSGPDLRRRDLGRPPGADLPLALRRRADQPDQDGHPGRRRRQRRQPRFAGRDVRVRLRRDRARRLRPGRDLRRQRHRLLHPDPADRLHDVAPGARPGLRLGDAALVPDAGRPDRTAATTPRRSPSTSSGTSRSSTTT